MIIDLKQADTLEDLSIMFDVPVTMLEKKINKDNPQIVRIFPYLEEDLSQPDLIEIDCNKVFNKIAIPKKNKNRKTKKRIVWSICSKRYEEFYKKLNYHLTNFVLNEKKGYPHTAAHGYIKGKNILENAQRHCGAPQILHADIANFFNSIPANRIAVELRKYGIKENVSHYLSKILTIEDTLPLGLHTSPLVSNLVCLQLDTDFSNLSMKYNCEYTRYADDITISGKQPPSREEVEAVLSKNSFELSVEKFRITKQGWKHFVTGLSVETETPRIPKYKKRRLRQELHYINKYGLEGHLAKLSGRKVTKEERAKAINRIDGTVSYISYFERKFSSDFEKTWFELRKKKNLHPTYKNKQCGCIHLFVDETEIDSPNGDKYLVVGVSSLMDNDIDRLKVEFSKLLNNYIKNPYEPINKDALNKNGLHYSDASEDLRKNFLEILVKEHLYTYIAYKKLQSDDRYEDIYIELLHNLIADRLLSTEFEITDIIIEKNEPKVIMKNVVTMLSQRARYRNVPKFKDKSCILLSSVDFALGYFRNYVLANAKEKEEKKEERKRLFFERIRSQYKVIKNLDDEKVFTRRRPFEGEL